MRLGHPGSPELDPRDLLEIEVTSAPDGRPSVFEHGLDLLADLVAAWTRTGPDRRRERSLSPQPPDGSDSFAHDARREPAPPGVNHRDRACAGDRDRQAVRGEHDPGDAGGGGRLAVRLLGFHPSIGRREGARHDRSVDLTAVGEPDPQLLGDQSTVPLHGPPIVVGEPPEVEARVRPLREPTPAGREDRAGAGEVDRDVLAEG